MIQVVVSIRDAATGAYSRPAFVAAEGAAFRSFRDEVNRNDPANELFRHPGDFDLFRLGTFDDVSGTFAPEPVPVLMVKGVSVKEA